MTKLIFIGADGAPEVPVPDQGVTFGRSSDCDLPIQDLSMSGHHGTLRFESGKWMLHDTNSSNGSFVNGRRVTDAELHNGDTLQFGDMQVRFVTDAPSAQPAPAPMTEPAPPAFAYAQPQAYAHPQGCATPPGYGIPAPSGYPMPTGYAQPPSPGPGSGECWIPGPPGRGGAPMVLGILAMTLSFLPPVSLILALACMITTIVRKCWYGHVMAGLSLLLSVAFFLIYLEYGKYMF